MTERPHLRSIDELSLEDLVDVLDLTDHMVEVCRRPVPKVPALRGRTVLSLFFEDSTRTRLSFETAAKRLSADTMTFSASSSSVNKGESLRDTVETLDAMGIDAVVVRHRSAGVPWQIARWTSAAIINAGDGWHEHPTQALLDAYTVRTEHPRPARPWRRVAARWRACTSASSATSSTRRVARSNVRAFTALGAQVTLVARRTLLPPSVAGWGAGADVAVTAELDDVLPKLDVAYVLRMQLERQEQALVPSLREYTNRFGLTPERAARLPGDALIMHPGPMNRGVEIAPEVADRPNAVITNQVANGVAVRMAVLYRLLGSGVPLSGPAASAGRIPVAELVIKGATVVDQRGTRRADVAVEDGRIVARGPGPRRRPEVLDAGGCVLAPGLVDLHTHLRQPGHEEAETVETGAGPPRSAATPRSSPCRTPSRPSTRAAMVREVLDLGRAALCDVHVAGRHHRRPGGEKLAPMAEMAALGVRLFTDDGRGRAGRPADAAGARVRQPTSGVMLAQHCEDEALAAGRRTCTRGSGRAGSACPGMPAEAEELMVHARPRAGPADRRARPLPAPVHGRLGRAGAGGQGGRARWSPRRRRRTTSR